MAALEWSEALALELPAMDEVHQEFVLLLAEVEAAPDAQLCMRWDELIAHTQMHFDQEDRWMQSTRFSSSNCHSLQHKVVLQVMREGAQQAAAGDLAVVRRMAGELGAWFTHHAQTMDAALALHLRSAGFDPATGTMSHPESLPVQVITGCGGACDGSVHPSAAVAA
ncbi:MAG: hemerythrin [Burkholderiaceae bacterium]|nr:hemerythrin [Burkholderiaceae bacterium]